MELKCTNCNDNIDAQSANVQTDLVQCPNCHTIHKLSELIEKSEELLNKDEFRGDEVRDIMPMENRLPSKLNQLSIPPQGSKINSYFSRSGLEIEVPPRGLQGVDAFMIGFTIFWLGFVAFWTVGAASASVFFALFSIPFWFVGIMLAKGTVNKLTERQVIQLDRYSLRVRKQNVFTTKVNQYNLEDIDTIKMIESKISGFKGFQHVGRANTTRNGSLSLPTIRAGLKETNILENAHDAEQEWVLELLEEALLYYKNT